MAVLLVSMDLFALATVPAGPDEAGGPPPTKFYTRRDNVLNGSLPPRALRLVRAWARMHRDELAVNWELAQDLEPLVPIEPLP
jgi:hypothetical protein